ncbi:MAG: repeat-containing protein [Acidobacteria bacterium]|jgi:tetratricopeptide (TPR) repeat protein|nr:repeat-containing protein [Acidobacteriota bacterium]
MCSLFRRFGLFLILPLVFGLTFSVAAFSQNRILGGKVTNDKGETVVNCKIQILGVGSKRELTTKTDKKGEWIYMNIPTGTYNVVARADGYSPGFQANVQPGLSYTAVNITLTPGDPNQKLAFELTPEEQEKLRKEMEKQKERGKMAGEIKAAFEAGLALSGQGKYAEAIVEFNKALEKAPDEVYVLANLADAYFKNGQNQEALDTYQKAIALKPDDAALVTNQGVVLGKMGKTEESKAAFQKAASLDPGAAAQNFYNLGATMVNSGQAKDAAEAFRQAIKADASYAEAYYQLGLCLSGDPGTIGEALQMLQKYLSIGKDPTNLEVAKQLIATLKK